MTKRKLGILLSTPPEHPNLQSVLGLAGTALDQGVVTYLYLVDEGVNNIHREEIALLSESGLKLFICAYGAQRHGIPVSNKAVFCGLVFLSDLLKGCDRFIVFN